MPTRKNTAPRKVFVIIDPTAIPHPHPAWLDEHNHPVTFATEHEAQVEIANWMIDKLNEFIAGERDFDDATACNDFVLAVDLSLPN